MRIHSVKINNILSISDISIDFDESGLVLIDGWNHDDNRANGAGKTAIFNALTFGLFGELPRKITSSEILKKGCKNGFVEVILSIGNDVYKVRRERPKKEYFEKNNQSISLTQKEFESKIKLSYDQFLVSMYSAQTSGNKFLSLNDSSKKDFLLQLMNLTGFNECKDFIKNKVKNIELELNSNLSKLESLKAKIEVYKENLQDESDILQKISKNDAKIEESKKEIIEYQKVQKPDISKFLEIETNLNNVVEEIIAAKAERKISWKEYEDVIRDNKDFSISPDFSCPGCNLDLKINNGSIMDVKELEKQHKVKAQNNELKRLNLKNKIDELDSIIVKEKELKNILSELKARKDKEYERYNFAINAIRDLNSAIALQQQNNSHLKNIIENNNNLKNSISSIETKISTLTEKIAKVNNDMQLNLSLVHMFSSTGAPAYVLDSVIEMFNESIMTYVSLIWPNASYQLKSYKEKKDGDLIAKFSETFMMAGDERSVGSLSGGEFRSLSLAVDFAIIDVISKQFGMQLNPIIMDEPFEGLDAVSRESVIELLEKIATDRQIIVVDHMSEAKAMFNKVIKVEKKNGTSYIANAPDIIN